MTAFIFCYILIGVVLAIILSWDEIKEVFERSEPGTQKPLTKDEWQEFIILMLTWIFGWGIALIMMVIDLIK